MSEWRKLTAGERKLARVKKEQTEAVARRTKARVEELNTTGGSSSVDTRGPQPQATFARRERIGRGQIDRYGVPNLTEQHEQREVDLTSEYIPEPGTPAPRPDPRYHSPLNRATRLKTETATWTGVVQEEGRLEWCRTNKTGNQEWLSAIEVEPRQWQITKSKTTSSAE